MVVPIKGILVHGQKHLENKNILNNTRNLD